MSKTEVVCICLAAALISLLVLTVGVEASTNNFYKYGSIEHLSDAIDEGEFVDDSINWKKYKNWTHFELASEDLRDCIEHRYDLSNNLADYEIYNCYEEHEED